MRKQKLVTVVIRGCVMRVTRKRAHEIINIMNLEKEIMADDWNKNRVD